MLCIKEMGKMSNIQKVMVNNSQVEMQLDFDLAIHMPKNLWPTVP